MLTKDQKDRLSLLRTMVGDDISKKEAIEALEANYWDTAMATEWLKKKEAKEEITLEEFHESYEKAREKAVVLPSDRYDLGNNTKAVPQNRRQRRAAAKQSKRSKN